MFSYPVPQMPPAHFSAGTPGTTTDKAYIVVQNLFPTAAAILLVHVAGSGAIEWQWTAAVDPEGFTTPLKVHFGDDAHDYWICTAWVVGDDKSPYFTRSIGTEWTNCGIPPNSANQQLTFTFSASALTMQMATPTTVAPYSNNGATGLPFNLEVVNKLANNVSVFIYYFDNGLLNVNAWCQNGMTMGAKSPLLPFFYGSTVLSTENWIIQAVDFDAELAYVTNSGGSSSFHIGKVDANSTITMSLSTSEVTIKEPNDDPEYQWLPFTSQKIEM